MPSEKIRNLLKSLPHKPGVYQHLDADGRVLYVGKAKDLQKRVSSYYTKSHESTRIHVMTRKVAHVRTIVTESGCDALLLATGKVWGNASCRKVPSTGWLFSTGWLLGLIGKERIG